MSFRAFSCGLTAFCLAVASGFAHPTPASAGIEESRFSVSADGSSVEFELREVPRREVLARLFVDKQIRIQWLDASFAAEPITGTFVGTPAAVARNLLAQADFALVYDGVDTQARVTGLMVLGRASTQNVAALAAFEHALRPDIARAGPIAPPPAGARPPALTEIPAPPLVTVPGAAILVPPPIGGGRGIAASSAGHGYAWSCRTSDANSARQVVRRGEATP